MALKQCKECGNAVSSMAEACPKCGAVLKKKTGCVGLLAGAICIFIILVVMGGYSGQRAGETSPPSTKPDAGLKLPSVGNQIVTFEEYQKIQNGMSYRQVVQIIGAEGEEISRNRIDGVPGVMESIETVMYQWVNSNASNMNAIFQNDKLMQKAQFGLR